MKIRFTYLVATLVTASIAPVAGFAADDLPLRTDIRGGAIQSQTHATAMQDPDPTSGDAASDDLEMDRRPLGAEYLIVTSRSLVGAFEQLAHWKRRHGTTTDIRTVAWIRRHYPVAVDDAERIRLCIRDSHARGTRWVLLGGDTQIVPTRIVHAVGLLPPRDFESDYYFACLDGNWNADGDGFFGEAPLGPDPGDDVDLVPEVSVGRAPVSTVREARNFVEKTIDYTRGATERGPELALFMAEVLLPKPWTGGTPILDLAVFAEQIVSDNPTIQSTRLYENYADPLYRPGALAENRASVLEDLASGAPLSVFYGAGSPTQMSVGPDLLTAGDVATLDDRDHLTNLVSFTSLTHAIGQDCIAEAFLRARGGAVSSLGPSTVMFVASETAFAQEFFRLLLSEQVATVGELANRHRQPGLIAAQQSGPIRDYVLATLLLGDPQLPLDPARVRPGGRDHHVATERMPPLQLEPSRLTLSGPFPNPASGRVSFTIEVPSRDAIVEIGIFDLAGRRVRRIEPASTTANGKVFGVWDLRDESGRRVSKGLYFVSARIGGAKVMRRLLVAP